MCRVEMVEVEAEEGHQGVEDRRGSPICSPEDEEQETPYFLPVLGVRLS